MSQFSGSSSGESKSGPLAAIESSLKAMLPAGLYSALRLLGKEVLIYRLHRKGVKKARAYATQSGLNLNIGCGANQKQGWVNIDLFRDMDLSLDMRERIPLPNSSAKMIYSEHFFEHLDYPEDARKFIEECHRLLEPGGTISLGVPDTQWPLEAYVGPDDKGYFALVKEKWHPAWCRTRLEHINYHFRQGTEHRFAYDFETLRRVLAEAGFVNIRERAFDRNLDDESRKEGTLYVEATK
jgi:predicted SAM-dependent methyltransferase